MASPIIPDSATVTSNGYYVIEPATTTELSDNLTIEKGGFKLGFDFSRLPEDQKRKARSMVGKTIGRPAYDLAEIDRTKKYRKSDYNMIADTRQEFIEIFGRTPLPGVHIPDQGCPTGPKNILFYEGLGYTITTLDFTKANMEPTVEPDPEQNFFGIKILY